MEARECDEREAAIWIRWQARLDGVDVQPSPMVGRPARRTVAAAGFIKAHEVGRVRLTEAAREKSGELLAKPFGTPVQQGASRIGRLYCEFGGRDLRAAHAMTDLRESWALTTAHLSRAAAMAADQDLSAFREYLDNNELQLAADVLVESGTAHGARPRSFWEALGYAYDNMGLSKRAVLCVPYVFETCAGDSWRLHRDVSAREKQMFAQKRLKGSTLERKLPIEFHADWGQSDDVTWLVRPPWVSSYREPADGRPEPGVELLGQTEYSATDYFGNEASDVSFYAAAAILFEVPPTSARKRVAGD